MAFTVTTSGAMHVKAGAKAAESSVASGALVQYSDEGEAYISNLVKYDVVTNWASLNAIYKQLFSEWVANYGGINIIMHDMSGYTDGIEAENMIKILWQRNIDIQNLLNDASVQDFQGV